MRILICSNAYPPNFVGGAELMAHEQAKSLMALGHQVEVFAGALQTDKPRYEQTHDVYEGILVHRISLLPEDYSPEFLNFLHPDVDLAFRDILRKFQPDIVHCHNLIGLSVKLPILAQLYGASTVCTLHDFWGFCLTNTAIRNDGQRCDDISECRLCVRRIHDGRKLNISMRFRKDMIRFALDHIDRFLAPSQFMASRYISAGFDPTRIDVVPNGVDTGRFHPSAKVKPKNKVHITYVGYFGAHKGVETLLDAIGIISKRGKEFVLQLVGDGPSARQYRERINALGLHNQVRFSGKVQNAEMPEIYAQSDIVVVPSIWEENQPVTIMEAMASGVAVVASRKGGIPELIEHGKNGLLFAAGHPHHLAAKLSELIDDPQLCKAMGERGRGGVLKFGHGEQAQRLVAIYSKVLGRKETFTPSSRELYVAIGGLKPKMASESDILNDQRYASRAFIPFGWIADTLRPVDGLILTGRLWSFLQRLGIRAMIPLPRKFRKNAARGFYPVRR